MRRSARTVVASTIQTTKAVGGAQCAIQLLAHRFHRNFAVLAELRDYH
jgi:hypothetical protein